MIFFISFSFILYACMFCAYSKQSSLQLRLLQFVHFRDRKKRRGTFTELSNSKTFPFGIAFLIWAFHFFRFLKQCAHSDTQAFKTKIPLFCLHS